MMSGNVTAEESFLSKIFIGQSPLNPQPVFCLTETIMQQILDLLKTTPKAQEIIKEYGDSDWINLLLKNTR